MRLFVVKLILSNQQKYEPRSTFFIFDIFQNCHHTKQNYDKTPFVMNIWKKMCVLDPFLEHLPHVYKNSLLFVN